MATLKNIVDDLLASFGITGTVAAGDALLGRIVNDVNAAIQMAHLSPHHEFGVTGRQEVAPTVVNSRTSFVVPETVQSIQGAVMWKPTADPTNLHGMSPVDSLDELEYCEALYGIGGTLVPLIYFHQQGVSADGPTGITDEEVVFNAVFEPTSFTVDDVCAPTPPDVPMPHRYVESLLIPIVRFRFATTNRVTRNLEATMPHLKAEYDIALQQLGLAVQDLEDQTKQVKR